MRSNSGRRCNLASNSSICLDASASCGVDYIVSHLRLYSLFVFFKISIPGSLPVERESLPWLSPRLLSEALPGSLLGSLPSRLSPRQSPRFSQAGSPRLSQALPDSLPDSLPNRLSPTQARSLPSRGSLPTHSQASRLSPKQALPGSRRLSPRLSPRLAHERISLVFGASSERLRNLPSYPKPFYARLGASIKATQTARPPHSHHRRHHNRRLTRTTH